MSLRDHLLLTGWPFGRLTDWLVVRLVQPDGYSHSLSYSLQSRDKKPVTLGQHFAELGITG